MNGKRDRNRRSVTGDRQALTDNTEGMRMVRGRHMEKEVFFEIQEIYAERYRQYSAPTQREP